jgi:hypothetical protein
MSDRHFGGFSRNACGRAAGRNREAAFSVERDQPLLGACSEIRPTAINPENGR